MKHLFGMFPSFLQEQASLEYAQAFFLFFSFLFTAPQQTGNGYAIMTPRRFVKLFSFLALT